MAGPHWTNAEQNALNTAAVEAANDVGNFIRHLRALGCERPLASVYERLRNKTHTTVTFDLRLLTDLYKYARGANSKRLSRKIDPILNPLTTADKQAKSPTSQVGKTQLLMHIRYIIDGEQLGYHSAEEAYRRIVQLVARP